MMSENEQLWQERWQLRRYPHRNQNLRAWDAADELAIDHLRENLQPEDKVLIVNDGFGALALALHEHQCGSLGDSYLSKHALSKNWQMNRELGNLDSAAKPPPWFTLAGEDVLTAELEDETKWDWVVLKIPKSLALLRHYLQVLRPHLHAQSKVVAGMMVKYLRQSMISEFEKHLGPTHTSLAKKKARLVMSQVAEPTRENPSALTLRRWKTPWQDHIEAYPACFAADKIDRGSQFMLEHLNLPAATASVVDVGCGTGILGIRAQKLCPQAQVHFLDESFLAIASARLSYAANFPEERAPQPSFQVADGFSNWQGGLIDVVLCNPPFHQQNTVTLDLAQSLFSGAARHLEKSGQFWVIANRHLPYRAPLKRLFVSVEVVAQNSKFILYLAQQPKKT